MKVYKIFSLFLSAAILIILGSCEEDDSSTLRYDVGFLRGSVKNIHTDEVLSGVTVTLSNNGGNTTTDDGGNFRLRDITPGTYTVKFSKDEFLTKMVDVEIKISVDISLTSELELANPPTFELSNTSLSINYNGEDTISKSNFYIANRGTGDLILNFDSASKSWLSYDVTKSSSASSASINGQNNTINATIPVKDSIKIEVTAYFRRVAPGEKVESITFRSNITIKEVDINIIVPNLYVPSIPSLVSPSNTGMLENDTLMWMPSTDLQKEDISYIIFLDKMTMPVNILGSTSNTLFVLDDNFHFQEDSTYYWRVEAIDVSGSNSTSNPWSFVYKKP